VVGIGQSNAEVGPDGALPLERVIRREKKTTASTEVEAKFLRLRATEIRSAD